ncbi:hypothetical protein P4284_07740 [Bacillus swezeyi]|nr:hypothetical protein [Bacillus swezeyi]
MKKKKEANKDASFFFKGCEHIPRELVQEDLELSAKEKEEIRREALANM